MKERDNRFGLLGIACGLMPRNLDYETRYEQFAWDLPHTYNMGMDICDRNAVDKSNFALIHDRGNGDVEKWSFFELKRASDSFANTLRAFGVDRGDEMTILLTHSPALAIAHAATYKLGAIAAPLSTLFGEEALRFRLEGSGAKVILTHAEHHEVATTLREEVPDIEHTSY